MRSLASCIAPLVVIPIALASHDVHMLLFAYASPVNPILLRVVVLRCFAFCGRRTAALSAAAPRITSLTLFAGWYECMFVLFLAGRESLGWAGVLGYCFSDEVRIKEKKSLQNALNDGWICFERLPQFGSESTLVHVVYQERRDGSTVERRSTWHSRVPRVETREYAYRYNGPGEIKVKVQAPDKI